MDESPGADDPAVAWLQGFLHAFAWFNSKTDHGYTLTLDVLPKPGSAREAIKGHFRGEWDELTLTPVEDWSAFVRGLLGRWLFQFSDRSMDHLEDPRESFSLFHDHFRGMLLDELMGRLSGLMRGGERSRHGPVVGTSASTRMWRSRAGRVVYLHVGFSVSCRAGPSDATAPNLLRASSVISETNSEVHRINGRAS